MPTISALTTFTANTQIKSAEVNANFSSIRTTVNTFAAFVDQAATISGAWTFTTAPTINAALTLGGTLTVSTGGAAITGNSTITGDVTINGALGGTYTVPAAKVAAGTLGTGAFTTNGSLIVTNGQLRAPRATQSGAGGTVNFATANHIRHTMTGNGTLTLSGGVTGGVYTVEVLQDGTGGRTVAWAGGVVWAGGATPTATTTANRKDIYTFLFDGTNYCGVQFGANFASAV